MIHVPGLRILRGMNQHPFWKLELSENGNTKQNGFLLLTPCPGSKGINLESSLDQLSAAGSRMVISLMPWEELEQNGLNQMRILCARFNMQWLHLPIEDDHAPESDFEPAFMAVWPQIKLILDSNEGVSIHCKGGTGRTGLVAARILLLAGWKLEEAAEKIRKLRPNALQLPVHQNYIQQFVSA
ncbi:cyclin-dependent kinase inhibitor 3 family protein [Spirochaeta dissipatitropha]